MRGSWMKVTSLMLAALMILTLAGCAQQSATEPDKQPSEAPESAGEATEQPKQEGVKLKIATLMEGPMNDGGWNIFAYEGLQMAQAEYGAEITYTDNVTANDMAQLLRQYAMQGYNVLIGHGYAFGDALTEVAAEFPDVKFINYGGSAFNGTNLAAVQFAYGEGTYVMGAVAGTTEGISKIGMVSAFENATVKSDFENFKLSALKYNDKVEIVNVYTGDYNDVNKAKEAVLALLADGCDLIVTDMSTGQDAMLEAVRGAGKKMMHTLTDLMAEDPDTLLWCGIEDIAKATFAAIREVYEGRFQGKVYAFGINDGAMGFGVFGNAITEEQKTLAEELEGKIRAGEIELLNFAS
ncbi:MAG: BMP family protein [Bacillota bacterium]